MATRCCGVTTTAGLVGLEVVAVLAAQRSWSLVTDITIPTDERLKLSRDRKVSPIGYDGGMMTRQSRNGKPGRQVPRGMVAKMQNSFGIPAGTSCPGKTSFCLSCYADNSETYFPNVGKAMRHNWAMLEKYYAEHGMAGYIALLREAMGRFRRSFDYQGLPEEQRIFRIHWDGDFFSMQYAAAWTQIIHENPDVKYWAYTRSFGEPLNVLPALRHHPNLALYLSIDAENHAAAVDAVAAEPWVRQALCATDYRSARALHIPRPDGQRTVACPENALEVPLMSDDGVGACVACGLCVRGRRDILFSTSHVEDVLYGQTMFDWPEPEPTPVTIGPRRG